MDILPAREQRGRQAGANRRDQHVKVGARRNIAIRYSAEQSLQANSARHERGLLLSHLRLLLREHAA